MANNLHQDSSTSCLGSLFSRLGFNGPSSSSYTNIPGFSVDEKLPAYEECIDEALDYFDLKKEHDFEKIVKKAIQGVSAELRAISLDLHKNVEISMKEFHAHDVLTDYMESKGFIVTRHTYGMETSFTAEYSRGSGRRVGICSEYDGLPFIGQACGHNLIAISGVATAIAVKALLDSKRISGKVILFGTPGEERSIGKIIMVDKRAFQDNVDVCMMLHPSNYDAQFASLIAINDVKVEFFGKSTHASGTPWDGVNALDAMVQLWNNVSMLRQQLKPTDRVHGIVSDGGQSANSIPEYTSALFFIRTTKTNQLGRVMKKFENCFKAAALATGCEVKWQWREIGETKDVLQNNVMAKNYAHNMERLGVKFMDRSEQDKLGGGSTDMGNVSYEVPTIHPLYNINTTFANHTVGFTEAAKTVEAHECTLRACQAIALTAAEVFKSDKFYHSVKKDFEENIRS
ncbi:hypothetical protein BDF14DRAFT_1750988 [Spinellus fusiger]|nr:hypothetical protein BDF14DRAFT_1750988 [Spinellus fusiger]